MLKVDQVVMVRGVQVRIIDIDNSDDSVLVHGVAVSNPDQLIKFFRDEIGR